MKKIGLVVNPVAGMGGKVGLKGTDTFRILKEALRRGAKPISNERTERFLVELIKYPEHKKITFVIPEGNMGANIISSLEYLSSSLIWNTISQVKIPQTTTRGDTIAVAKYFKKINVDLIIFVGGDGTARDILDAVGDNFPILGIPSGVKVHSGVFALSIEKGVEILRSFVQNQIEFVLSEIIDLNEAEFRQDRIVTKLFGVGLVPRDPSLMQSIKTASPILTSERDNLQGIIKSFKELLDPRILYFLGSGSTLKELAKAFGNEVYEKKTLLGIDAVQNFTLVAKDLAENDILCYLRDEKPHQIKIIVTPIGGQGFIFGRGNQPFSPVVIRKIGFDRIEVVATRSKIEQLTNMKLHVDTGDYDLDQQFIGYIKVLVDYETYLMVKVD